MAKCFHTEYQCLLCAKWYGDEMDARSCCKSYGLRYKCEKCGKIFNECLDDADEHAMQCCEPDTEGR